MKNLLGDTPSLLAVGGGRQLILEIVPPGSIDEFIRSSACSTVSISIIEESINN